MRSLAALSAVLLAGCSLYFGGDPSHSGGAGGGGISSDVDGGIFIPPPDDGGDDGVDAGYSGGCDPDGGVTGQPQLAAEAQWAACVAVSETEFVQTMANALSSAQSADGRCDSCHGEGGGSIYLSSNAPQTLHAWSTQAYVLSAYIPRPLPGPGGAFVYQMGVATEKICGAGNEAVYGNDAGVGPHPAYDCNATVSGTAPLAALESFRKLVQAKIDAGQCPAPGFATP